MSLTEIISFSKEGEPEPAGARNLIFRKLFLALVIILVALLSFGIGRLSAPGTGDGVEIEYDPSLSSVDQSASVIKSAGGVTEVDESSSGQVIASSNGRKYHYPHCSGAKQISEANKITFASALDAEASGYTLASNCKPR